MTRDVNARSRAHAMASTAAQAAVRADSDERDVGHACPPVGLWRSYWVGLPFVGPLIVWLIKKDQSPFVDDQAKEALNFQITVSIAFVVSRADRVSCVGFFDSAVLSAFGSLVFAIIARDGSQQGHSTVSATP